MLCFKDGMEVAIKVPKKDIAHGSDVESLSRLENYLCMACTKSL